MEVRSVLRLMGFAALTLASEGCHEGASVDAAPADPLPKPVRVETVEEVRLAPSIRVPGIVEARARIPLAFRVAGFVEEFLVDEGQRVDVGTVIARLDPRDAEREVRLARADLQRAEAGSADARLEFERQKKLLDSESISRQRYEKAKSAFEIARAEASASQLRLEEARTRLQDCELRAPVTAHVEKRLVEAHEFAAAEKPVVILTELDTVIVRAGISDRDLPRVQIGAHAAIRSPAWPDREIEGTVSLVAVAADASTRTVPIEVEVKNPELALRPAMVVGLELREAEAETIHAVPLAAVLRDATLRPFCFVLDEENGAFHAEQRWVHLGEIEGEHVAIRSGLRDGEAVVTRGQHFIKDGDRVEVVSE